MIMSQRKFLQDNHISNCLPRHIDLTTETQAYFHTSKTIGAWKMSVDSK